MVTAPQAQQCQPALESLLTRLHRVRKALHGWVACCPAHDDRQPSLSIGLGEEGQILLKCFAGCSLETIVESMGMSVADLFPSSPSSPDTRSKQTRRNRLTLLDLAEEKMLPWYVLFNLGVSEDKAGILHIPYYLQEGTPAPRHRLRTALVAREGSRWSKGKGQIVPYGLERLQEARKRGSLILVEGESDCWTLWFHKFAALGLPGAEMVGTLQESHLNGIKTLYILQEPDAGGSRFVKHLKERLQAWKWQGKVFVVCLPNAKDANELHKQDSQNFKIAFQQALDQAQPLSLLPDPSSSQTDSLPARPTPFTLQDLLARDLPPIRWAIPDILPEGLTLLAGKPKLGKSWLALSIALSIAAGGYALGKQPVTKGEVLYLALEDNERRLQSRAIQLLDAMSQVPLGIEFALDWPRLDQGGLQYLEEYLQTHPRLRLVIIDTWVKVSPLSGRHQRSQYENDYEALAPLKALADTYHVSILAVHHLRKMAASDALDEITGSTGLTGVVDGALILKRERSTNQASLFVTGRDIEQEQQLPLTFDLLTAQWTLDGNVENFTLSKERQQIFDRLKTQPSRGMSAPEVGRALGKNYNTTRTLLRKMEDAGVVRRVGHRYFAISQEINHHQCNHYHQSAPSPLLPATASDQIEQVCPAITDYSDYADCIHNDEHACPAETDYNLDTNSHERTRTDETDYSDYTDQADESTASHILRKDEPVPSGGNGSLQEAAAPAEHHHVKAEGQVSQSHHLGATGGLVTPSEGEQPEVPGSASMPQREDATGDMSLRAMKEVLRDTKRGLQVRSKKRCPRHPHTQWVRYDPSGQAWCDHLDCWICYRLMKIGEALNYRQLIAHTGVADSIEQGIEAWSCFVTSRSPFEVVVATQQAIALCKTLDVEVPDLSGEVGRLVRTQVEEG
jgi:AAA domain